MPSVQLQVHYAGAAHTVTLSAEPLTIGRAPSNRLHFAEPSVSWHHAIMWMADGEVQVQDLESTNGVFIDGVRLQGSAALSRASVVELGDRVRIVVAPAAASAPTRLMLEDLDQGRRFALHPGRNALAAMGLPTTAVIRLEADGALSAELGPDRSPIRLHAPLRLGGLRLRIVDTDRPPTVGQRDEPWPYRITARLDGPAGPEAELIDRVSGARHRVTAENRASLLYLLARQVRDDLAAGRPEADLGWCADDDLALWIWGRGTRAASTLPVMVHRLRKELEGAGLDAGFLEKGKRMLRARLLDVRVH